MSAINTNGLYSQSSHLLATTFHNLSLATGGSGSVGSLQQVLAVGNTTGGTDIIQSSGDSFISDVNADLRLELDGSGTVLVEQNIVGGSADPILTLQSNNNTSGGSNVEIYTNKSVPAINDELGAINYYGNMSSLTKQLYSAIKTDIVDPTTATATALMDFNIRENGTVRLPLRLYGDSIEPIAILDDLGSIGLSGEILTAFGSAGALRWKQPQKAPNQQVFAMNNTASFTFASLGATNTANKILIGSNSAITAQNGFTLDTINNRIVYNGISGERFLVQTSASLTSTATSVIGIELRQNLNAISQCRSNLVTTSLVDLHDFNVVQLNNGDYLEWFCAYTVAGASFTSASSTGLGGSTTKPYQISITQLLY